MCAFQKSASYKHLNNECILTLPKPKILRSMLSIRGQCLKSRSRLAGMEEAQCTDVLAINTDKRLADSVKKSCNWLILKCLKTVLMQGNVVQLFCIWSSHRVFQIHIGSEFVELFHDLTQ